MNGRRIPVPADDEPLGLLELPGDYCGPIIHAGDKPRVYFLLPVAQDPDVPRSGHLVHHVASPPHVFRECPDGSLEIRESIGASPGEGPGGGYYWHGYLDEGHTWRTC